LQIFKKMTFVGISLLLQKWYALHKRDLPWRETSSPYHIWLSEIILQQTRVMQGLTYYLEFTRAFPDIVDLAKAPLDEVLKLWQGLGYYTRARNLHETAKYISGELNGVFPGTYHELLKLKGVGSYTAAAIASISFREPVAVVDGNVFRVLSRIFGIDLPVDTSEGKVEFSRRAMQILDRENPHIHNQAIMELGALVCLPKKPHCVKCPLKSVCVALSTGTIELFPVRSGRKLQRIRYFNYFFIVSNGFTWLNKRKGKDIWHSLYEFPLIETPNSTSLQSLSDHKNFKAIVGLAKTDQVGSVMHYKHQLTHQTIHCSFYHLKSAEDPDFSGISPMKIKTGDLARYPVPRLIDKYLEDLNEEKGY
jgi:A/G-specific adenine glycosylase